MKKLLAILVLLGLVRHSEAITHKAAACNANASFTYSVSNKTITFTNTSTGSNKYYWYFGDGQTSSAASPVHTYANANRYLVILYAYDSTINGCEDSSSNYDVLVPGCYVTADFRYQITDSTVTFINNSYNYLGSASKYQWYFGDGGSSLAGNPTHKYVTSNSYNVMYVFSDTDYNNCSDTVFRTLSINDCEVTADFTYVYTGPKTIKVTNASSSNANYFSLPFDSNGEYIITYPHAGTFQLTLEARNTWCYHNDTAIKSVNVVIAGCHANASFSFGRDTNSTFAGILYDYSTYRSGATYKWHFGDGDSSSSKTPNHTYPGPGKYNLCLTIRDSICVSTYCDTIEYDSSGNMVGLTVPFTLQVVDAILSTEDVISEKDNVSVYPNPGSGVFTIFKESSAISEIRVFDVQGKLVVHENSSENKTSIDLTGFSNGIYIFVIKDAGGHVKALKIMKQ